MLSILFLLSGISLIFVYIKIPPGFIVWVTISKSISLIIFSINYTYTSELYPTRIRSTGLGIATAVGGLGSLLMPWIGIYLMNVYKYLPYLIYGILALISSIIVRYIKYET